jgi:hypothetical protein
LLHDLRLSAQPQRTFPASGNTAPGLSDALGKHRLPTNDTLSPPGNLRRRRQKSLELLFILAVVIATEIVDAGGFSGPEKKEIDNKKPVLSTLK